MHPARPHVWWSSGGKSRRSARSRGAPWTARPVGGLGTRSIGRSTDGSSDKSLPATRPGGALEGSPGQGPGSVAGLIPGSGGAAGICRTDH